MSEEPAPYIVRHRVVAPGLFEPADTPDGLPWLLGSGCSKCGEKVFPAMHDCPACVSRDSMQPVRLRGRGRIDRYVVAQRGPSGFRAPYIQAFVRLDDGPTVYSIIDGCPVRDDALAAGQVVEMRIAPVRADGAEEVIGWTFHPVEVANG